MVSEEVRVFEKEQRTASAVTQAKQCAWTKWNDIEPIKLSWNSLIAMEPLVISFLLHSTYDLLSNYGDIPIWTCACRVKVIRGLVPCTICMSTIASDVHMAT